jgi:hypothetical protein
MGNFGCGHYLHHFAESTGVFVSFAIGARLELLAFADARRRVQSLCYESDTSIDNDGV